VEHQELRCVCDYLGGAQAVNTWARPTPLAVGGELEQDERAEIVYAEIWSPVTALGVEEELRKVIIILDGEDYGKYVSLCGIRAICMCPPKDRIWAGRLFTFGSPHNSNPLLNTTLKFKQNVTVATLAGPAVAITQPFRVRLWGYVYKKDEIPGAFGSMQFPAQVIDRARGRTLLVNKPPIAVNADSWLTLPGGKDQSVPKINPFARYAYNLLATDGLQGDYQFRLVTGGVTEEQENLYWEFDEFDALIVESLGAKAAANLARTGLRIAGDYHPKGPTTVASMFPTTLAINELNYGFLFPFAPVTHPYFAAIPKLDRPYLIWNEIGYVVIRDDAVGPVAANAVQVALTGIRIEMRS
jgi:hypothetical protein